MKNLELIAQAYARGKPLRELIIEFNIQESRTTIRRKLLSYFGEDQYAEVVANIVKLNNENQKKAPTIDICGNCGISYNKTEKNSKYCSHKCAAIINNKNRISTEETRQKRREIMQRKGFGFGQNPKHDYDVIQKNKEKHKNQRILKICEHCSVEFSVIPSQKNKKYCSSNCAYKNAGGYREGSGRGNTGHYQGIFCQSSYEFIFVFMSLYAGKNVIRNTEGFPYRDEANESHLYYPDFIIDDVYYEIKGWMTEKDKCKFRDFHHPLIVVDRQQIEAMTKIVEKLSGVPSSDFFKIYGGKPKNIFTGEKSTCQHCNNIFASKKNSKNIFCSRSCSGKYVAKSKG